jgi:hypothetical protein
MNGMAACGFCGQYHIGECPKVKAREYYPNGTLKRIEFHELVPTLFPLPFPQPIWYTPYWKPINPLLPTYGGAAQLEIDVHMANEVRH